MSTGSWIAANIFALGAVPMEHIQWSATKLPLKSVQLELA